MRYSLFPLLTLLAACGTATRPSLPDGRTIDTPDFVTYVTGHNGYSRVRRDYGTEGDAAVLAQFEDADPTDPAGYRNLIALNESLYGGRMNIEVIAEVDTGDGTVRRLLRLTADQSPFVNEAGGELIAATGRFYLRGANYNWVSIDDGPLIGGSDATGLVDMVLDLDSETVSLNLRTGVGGDSLIRTEITVVDMPLNIRSGAYGGDIVIQVWDPDSADILAIDGALRGNLGGTPIYGDGQHDLTTSGLYTADGVDDATGRRVRIDGVYMGRDPNAH